MGIGASIFLIAVGALLAFAVQDASLGGVVDINTAGWVLMIVGAIGLVVTLIIWGNRRRTVVEPPADTVRERRIIDDDRL